MEMDPAQRSAPPSPAATEARVGAHHSEREQEREQEEEDRLPPRRVDVVGVAGDEMEDVSHALNVLAAAERPRGRSPRAAPLATTTEPRTAPGPALGETPWRGSREERVASSRVATIDLPRSADAIVSLDGDRPRRLRRAVELAARGVAPTLVVVRAEAAAPELLTARSLPFEVLSVVPERRRRAARLGRSLASPANATGDESWWSPPPTTSLEHG